MSTKRHEIRVSGIPVEIVRKDIKNLHLGVYPPEGRVRVATPLKVSDEAVRLAVVTKLGWIKRQQQSFRAQPRQSAREMVSGESHYFLGHRYRLQVVPIKGRSSRVHLRNRTTLELHVPEDSSTHHREAVLQRWYRQHLKDLIPPLLKKWEKLLEVEATHWGVRRMKTRWGSCNPDTRRVWLNLELAKKPVQCIEYVLVHELTHLIERRHNDRFVAVMNRHLPSWRRYRKELNAYPLAHEDWV